MTLTSIFIAISIQYHLPPGLLEALCFVETRHVASAIHYDDGGRNSVGICQLQLRTAQDLGFEGTEEDLLDPATNIHYAAKYLSGQISRYHGNLEKAVIAYNRGNAKDLTTTEYQRKVYIVWRGN